MRGRARRGRFSLSTYCSRCGMNKLNTIPMVAGIFTAADLHPAFMFLDDAQRDQKPRPVPLMPLVEKWLEDAGQRCFGHAIAACQPR
jgi:hypothetical protein